MAESYVEAEKDYMDGMKYKDIATKYNTTINTVKSWKQRYGWCKDKNGAHQKVKKVCTPKKYTHTIDDGTKETLQNKALTDEQQMFCIYYSKSFNATQSYIKAYGCTYDSAKAHGFELLQKVAVREEIMRLKDLKRLQIITGAEDIIEKQMRIAFADIGDYLKFGREEVTVMGAFGPVMAEDENGDKKELRKVVNTVKFNESCNVDTSIIQEVKQGKDGASIKLADPQKAMDWLTKYFVMNPTDKYKAEFEKLKLEQEQGSATGGVTIVNDIPR